MAERNAFNPNSHLKPLDHFFKILTLNFFSFLCIFLFLTQQTRHDFPVHYYQPGWRLVCIIFYVLVDFILLCFVYFLLFHILFSPPPSMKLVSRFTPVKTHKTWQKLQLYTLYSLNSLQLTVKSTTISVIKYEGASSWGVVTSWQQCPLPVKAALEN